MVKVTGLNELAQAIEYDEIVRKHIQKAERQARQTRVKQLMAQGIDRELAQVMANVGL